MSTCRFVAKDAPRLLRTHLASCETPGCSGCEPCGERHCGLCRHRHLDASLPQTCATCVGEVRDGIDAILELTWRMPAEALVRGVRSEAAMLAGPAADVDRWRARYQLALWGRIDDAWLEDCRDEAHPLWVLGTWDREVCLHYGHDRSLEVTLGSAAAYISGHLTSLAQDAGFAFDELARDVRRCRTHLEVVLHDEDPTERGVPCPSCSSELRTGPDLVKAYAEVEGDQDGWTCPRCHQWWSDEDYRRRVGAGYLLHADRLSAADIERAHRVAMGTVRQWANRGKVRKHGRDVSGRLLYDVGDVLRQRDRGVSVTTTEESA